MRLFFGLIFLASSLSLFSQNKSNPSFEFELINHSAHPVQVQFLDFNGFVNSQQKKIITRKIPGEKIPFLVFVYIKDSTQSGGYRQRQIRIFSTNTTSRKIQVDEKAELKFSSDRSEEIYDDYFFNLKRSNFWIYTDSIVSMYNKDLAAAEIVGTQICRPNYTLEQIQKYYDKLSDSIKQTTSGRLVSKYLDSRKRRTVGAQIANFALKDSSGLLVQLKNIKSEFILLDFWFSSCKPCIESFPGLVSLYQHASRDKFEIIGLSVDAERMRLQWKSAIRKYQLPWINLHDPAYAVSYYTFAIENYPTQLLLNKDRQIIRIDPTQEELKALLSGNQ